MSVKSTAGAAGRLLSLDAYRGFVMLAMASDGLRLTEVARHFKGNSFWDAVGYQFDHVPWLGCAAWDLIQPSFTFMVGVAMAYSYAARAARGQSYGWMLGHALWRSLVLVLLGVFLRSNFKGQTDWTFEDVLSQIGLGYTFLFLLWGRRPAVQLAAAALILLADWALFAAWPLPGADFDFQSVGVPPDWQHLAGFAAHWDKNSNVGAAFDHWFLGLFPYSRAYPFNEGGYLTLSFIPSLATMIFGLVAGEMLRGPRSDRAKLGIMLAAGVAGLVVGQLLEWAGICPVVKRIWTPSWTIFAVGWTFLLLAGFYAVIEMLSWRRWTFPLVVVGANSIVMYVMAETLAQAWIPETLHRHFGRAPFQLGGPYGEQLEPFWTSLATLVVMWLVCYWLYRKKVFVRI